MWKDPVTLQSFLIYLSICISNKTTTTKPLNLKCITSAISNALPGLEPTTFRSKAEQAVTTPPSPSEAYHTFLIRRWWRRPRSANSVPFWMAGRQGPLTEDRCLSALVSSQSADSSHLLSVDSPGEKWQGDDPGQFRNTKKRLFPSKNATKHYATMQ